MENFFSRYKNPLVLMLVLFIQVVGLATQVKRAESAKAAGGGGPRLIRVWTVAIITPFEEVFSGTGHFFRHGWSNYIDLHNARKESRELQEQIARMKLEQAQLREDAQQAKRLQVLLEFREHYIGQTVAAQVIGTSGTDQSRLIYIDKGSRNAAGIKSDMPVITPDGVVGKIKEVFPFTSQVLLVNDHESGAGVVLQNSRLQGILRGTPQGQLIVTGVMSDEKIEVGDHIVTSGGDRIYPKGVPVGIVTSSTPDVDNDPFLKISVKPAAKLDQLEEVLVVTKMAEEPPSVTVGSGPQRAADILSQRLPSAKQENAAGAKTPTATPTPAPAGSTNPVTPPGEKKTVPPVTAPKGTDQKALDQKKPDQKNSDQKKPAVAGQPSASPTPAAKSGESAKKPATDQKKPQAAGAAGTNPAATPASGAEAKKPAPNQKTDQKNDAQKNDAQKNDQKKKAQTPGAAATGTPANAGASGASPASGSSANGSSTTKKAKAPAKPKPQPDSPGQTATPVPTPTETPEVKKPEPEAQPTPPSGEEKPRQ